MRSALPLGTVTFLLTDVERSTRLLRELGAEAYSDALAEHRRVIREASVAGGGVEVDTQGDAFFFVFPTAPGAVAAAAAFTDALDAGEPDDVGRILGAIYPFLISYGHLTEARGWTDAALATRAGLSAEGLAELLMGRSEVARFSGDLDRAIARSRRSLWACRRIRSGPPGGRPLLRTSQRSRSIGASLLAPTSTPSRAPRRAVAHARSSSSRSSRSEPAIFGPPRCTGSRRSRTSKKEHSTTPRPSSASARSPAAPEAPCVPVSASSRRSVRSRPSATRAALRTPRRSRAHSRRDG